MENKEHFLKSLYDFVNAKFSKFGKIALTGSWAIYLHTKEYNKLNPNDIINLNPINPEDVDFIVLMDNPQNDSGLKNVKQLHFNNYIFDATSFNPSKGMKYVSNNPNIPINNFDIITRKSNDNIIKSIDNMNCLKINNLVDQYEDISEEEFTFNTNKENANKKICKHRYKMYILSKIKNDDIIQPSKYRKMDFSKKLDFDDDDDDSNFISKKLDFNDFPELKGGNYHIKKYKIIKK